MTDIAYVQELMDGHNGMDGVANNPEDEGRLLERGLGHEDRQAGRQA